ncbi:MAG: hypothetical protein B7Y31_08610, partial [Novosphingobium sp. 16-62-11]
RIAFAVKSNPNLSVLKVLAAEGYGADDLLKPPAQAAPARNVEPRRRSQDREDDPFDLPPEG